MASGKERRQHVATLRQQTRQYLVEARERRKGTFVEPEVAPAPELVGNDIEPAAGSGILPDPHLAALTRADPAPAPPVESAPSSTEAPPVAATKELPLGSLRLLGQGMIWRLNNLGILTLEDLIACDPRRLSEGLGPIGRLVRTEVWIEAAREMLSQG